MKEGQAFIFGLLAIFCVESVNTSDEGLRQLDHGGSGTDVDAANNKPEDQRTVHGNTGHVHGNTGHVHGNTGHGHGNTGHVHGNITLKDGRRHNRRTRGLIWNLLHDDNQRWRERYPARVPSVAIEYRSYTEYSKEQLIAVLYYLKSASLKFDNSMFGEYLQWRKLTASALIKKISDLDGGDDTFSETDGAQYETASVEQLLDTLHEMEINKAAKTTELGRKEIAVLRTFERDQLVHLILSMEFVKEDLKYNGGGKDVQTIDAHQNQLSTLREMVVTIRSLQEAFAVVPNNLEGLSEEELKQVLMKLEASAGHWTILNTQTDDGESVVVLTKTSEAKCTPLHIQCVPK